PREHLRGFARDGRARGSVGVVVQADAGPRLVLHHHVVTVRDELAHGRGGEAQAVLEDLDLLRNADAHRKAPRQAMDYDLTQPRCDKETPMGHADATMTQTAAARALSLDEYWMPFTPNRDFKHDPKMVVRAEGMHYWNDRGDKIIDGASGLFC